MNRPLLLLLLLSGLLAAGFAWATPLGGAPDEAAHLQYVRGLATEGRLPQLDLSKRRDPNSDANYEAHQPPLYYTLSVPLYLAGRAVGGEPGAGAACRFLSILLGLAGTWLVWKIARAVAPERPALWMATAAVAGLLPMRLAVIASVSNDALTEATASLALLVMVRAIRGPWSLRQAAVLGGVLGLALLAKASAVLLLPPALLAVLLASRNAGAPAPLEATPPEPPVKERRKRKRRAAEAPPPAAPPSAAPSVWLPLFLRTGAATLGVVLLLAGWWFGRNQALYGDPLGNRAFDWYFEDTPRWVFFRDQLGVPFAAYLGQMVLLTTFASFWGAFGHLERQEVFMGAYDPRSAEGALEGLHPLLSLLWPVYTRIIIPPPSWVYPLLLAATLLSLAGGLRYYLRWRQTWGEEGATGGAGAASVGVLVLHAALVFAALLRFNVTYFQGQGRYLFPALAVLSLGLAGGWLQWARKHETAAAWVIGGAMLLLALFALFGTVLPAFHTS